MILSAYHFFAAQIQFRVPVVERLYREAQEYALVSQRASPTVVDLAQVCLENELTPSDLRRTTRRGMRKRKRGHGKRLIV